MSIPGSLIPLFSTGSAAAGGFQVSRSLRFNSADSAYLNRTPSVAGNRKTWTWSGWVKKVNNTTSRQFIFNADVTSNNSTIEFSSNAISVFDYNSSAYQWQVITSAVFRDNSAWLHLVVAVDTTQGTASNRVKVYVNGTQQTFSTANYPTQDYQSKVNATVDHRIGSLSGDTSFNLDGYLANVQFIDGQALTPSSFTEVSATTGQLIPKAYTGTYGQVSVAAATGGLPIWNTTDTYGAAKGSGTRTDASSSSIVLALPMDGTNGGTSFGDQSAVIKGSGSAKTVTVNGNTNTSTAQSKFYGSSAYFDGAGDYLTLGSSADFAFGTGDFTIEAFVYRPSGGGLQIFDHLMGTGNFTIFSYSNQAITVYSNAAYSSGVNPGNDRWFHLAVVRTSGVLSFFIDGVKAANTYSFTLNMTTAGVNIGSSQYSEYGTQYLQDLRVYKGLAKYTTNFSPVTISNSFYLQFADNSSNTATTLGKDTSGNGNNWTPNNFSVTAGNGNFARYVYAGNATYNGSETGTSYYTGAGSQYNGFDGNTSTYVGGQNVGASWVYFRPGTAISGVSQVRVYTAYVEQIYINGSLVSLSPSAPSATAQWYSVTSPASTINEIAIQGRVSDGSAGRFSAIEINGVVLVDNSFGSGNDSLVDTPTSYGTDTGVGGEVRGNYCTLNPLDNGGLTLANGNLDASRTTASWVTCRSTIGMSSGKWYWEVTCTTSGSLMIGIMDASGSLSTFVGNNPKGYGYNWDANKYNNGSGTSYGASYASGDVIGVAYDATAGSLVFYKNGSSQGTAYTSISADTYFPAISMTSTVGASANFGQRAFAYTAPSGFKALCDTNLPAPVVAKPNTLMDVVKYDGNSGSQPITLPGGFSPDLVWLKSRSNAYYNHLIDTVRGSDKVIWSNLTNAEQTSNTEITSFDSNGFTLGSGTGVNGSGSTYVAWCWKGIGNPSTSSTTINANAYSAGVPSITSQVRANVSAGFSVVTFTAPSSGSATIGHGLGVEPYMIIIKSRDQTYNWCVYHKSLTSNAYFLNLNTTAAQSNASNIWNNTTPTSSVFSLGSGYAGAGGTVAYCFSPVVGYSSFGSYVGNGSSDGPMVWTGFRPRWVMVKGSTYGSNWNILDAARDPYNLQSNRLRPNLSYAEDSTSSGTFAICWDALSNGFKLRGGSGMNDVNQTGETLIYAAFAEAPFQYARAR